jgi:hypothetical protein
VDGPLRVATPAGGWYDSAERWPPITHLHDLRNTQTPPADEGVDTVMGTPVGVNRIAPATLVSGAMTGHIIPVAGGRPEAFLR